MKTFLNAIEKCGPPGVDLFRWRFELDDPGPGPGERRRESMRRDDRAIPTALPLVVTLPLVAIGCTRKAPRQTVSPLQRAAKTNDLQRVQLLGVSGADVNGQDQNAWTPLHCAAFQGHSDLLVILLENGARARLLSEPSNAF